MNSCPIFNHLDDNVRKLFTDNRQDYINQSAATKNGVVAQFAAPLAESEPSPDFDEAGGALSNEADGLELFYNTLGI